MKVNSRARGGSPRREQQVIEADKVDVKRSNCSCI